MYKLLFPIQFPILGRLAKTFSNIAWGYNLHKDTFCKFIRISENLATSLVLKGKEVSDVNVTGKALERQQNCKKENTTSRHDIG